MNIKFPKEGGKGSCNVLIDYLQKEDSKREKKGLGAESFFSHSSDHVPASEVQVQIDRNTRKLTKDENRYFSFPISPSKEELAHIGNDSGKLKDYTRQVMEKYAEGFNKGLTSPDLVWYAKVEYCRTDRQTKQDKGEGNMHVHVVVSRRDAKQKFKLSPLSNAKGAYQTNNHIGTGGFDRKKFIIAAERLFDNSFSYDRTIDQTFEYLNAMRNGEEEEKKVQLERKKKSEQSLKPIKVEQVQLLPNTEEINKKSIIKNDKELVVDLKIQVEKLQKNMHVEQKEEVHQQSKVWQKL